MLDRCKPEIVIVVILLLMTCIPVGHASSHSGDEDNAAYWYDKVLTLNAAISDKDSELIMEIEWGKAPTSAQRAALSRMRPLLEALRRGAQQEYSDWYLDYDQGPGLLLQHLGA